MAESDQDKLLGVKEKLNLVATIDTLTAEQVSVTRMAPAAKRTRTIFDSDPTDPVRVHDFDAVDPIRQYP